MHTAFVVLGLSWRTDDEQLRVAFAAHGEVSRAKVILDPETGRSFGFGFVVLADHLTAQRAQAALDGQPLNRRIVRVHATNERRVDASGNAQFGLSRGDGRYTWVMYEDGMDMLFDVIADPECRIDCIDDHALYDVSSKLRTEALYGEEAGGALVK